MGINRSRGFISCDTILDGRGGDRLRQGAPSIVGARGYADRSLLEEAAALSGVTRSIAEIAGKVSVPRIPPSGRVRQRRGCPCGCLRRQ